MERTIKIKVLEGNPHQTSAGASGMAFASGTRLVVFECRGEEDRKDGFYSILDGVGEDGNFSESDDFGPFDTAEEAEQEARINYEESKEN